MFSNEVPMKLEYTAGDATAPDTAGNKVIAHVCNDRGGWGRGFVVALSARWPEPERDYRTWSRTTDFRLGALLLVQVEHDTWVANMVAQHGYRAASNQTPLHYDALEECLNTLSEHAARLGASVHMPRIGCGLVGGNWDDVRALLDRTLIAAGITTTVYDLTTPSP
jgi:O-acetyl-ADP-ribose deacetylase (regulator of RNase III)